MALRAGWIEDELPRRISQCEREVLGQSVPPVRLLGPMDRFPRFVVFPGLGDVEIPTKDAKGS